MEGHVNRIKMIKRQMYGRANPDLLRLRVLLAVPGRGNAAAKMFAPMTNATRDFEERVTVGRCSDRAGQ